MANTRELRRRIRSIKNTAQITKAMQMVAATKMRKAQNQALSGRPYSEALNSALSVLLPKIDPELHLLLRPNQSKATGVILLSTDKGLAGALNTNLFRLVQSFSKEKGTTSFYTIGKKGRQFIVKSGKNLPTGRQVLVADFENPETVSFRQAVQVMKLLTEAFYKGELGDVYLIYPQFVSTLKQEPTLVKLLPFEHLRGVPHSLHHLGGETPPATPRKDGSPSPAITILDFLFEPNVSELLDYVLTHQIEIKIYQALLETKASEHSARMIAMQNATENALELVDDLTLSYNQVRQEAITKEILEIATAGAALE